MSSIISNYIAIWQGEWGTLNQIYFAIYHIFFLPMLWKISATAIKGISKEIHE